MRARPAVIALVLAFACSACWNQFRGDAAHSGNQPLESTINAGNVGALHEFWHTTFGVAPNSSPVVSNGVVYLGVGSSIRAFDASGAGCAHTSSSCASKWTGAVGGAIDTTPAVVGGVAYVTSRNGRLSAFDAAGVSRCSGTPTTCQALWSATIAPTGEAVSSPVVSGGVVYVAAYSPEGMFAFDAAGSTNCGGSPRVCSPLWTGSLLGPGLTTPVVADGKVAVSSPLGNVFVFDAAGNTNCSGIPKVCQPMWAALTNASAPVSPAIVNGVMYVGAANGKLYAFDARGVTNCSGTGLRQCNPLWTASTGSAIDSSPAIANGMVYLGAGSVDLRMFAYDAAGVKNCSGVPKNCSPLWRSSLGVNARTSPVVANGVVYVGSRGANLRAYDAAGIANCPGTPKNCLALWYTTNASAFDLSPAIVGGTVYNVSANSLTAYVVP